MNANPLGRDVTTVDSQTWSDSAADALKDRDVVVMVDCDEKGEKNADATVTNVAKTIRSFAFPASTTSKTSRAGWTPVTLRTSWSASSRTLRRSA